MVYPHRVWAVAEVKHANHGWYHGIKAFLVCKRGVWRWELQALTAGISVDNALRGGKFRSVPTALHWAAKSTFMRNVEQLREWHERILIE